MKVPEKFRIKKGLMGSDESYECNGFFMIPYRNYVFYTIASDQMGWEHVSLSLWTKKGKSILRCPTWEEMCTVKAIFWNEDEAVLQFHPPKSEYVNNHEYCLHLWKQIDTEIVLPPTWMVGINDSNTYSGKK